MELSRKSQSKTNQKENKRSAQQRRCCIYDFELYIFCFDHVDLRLSLLLSNH